jgi:hypothetical protein
VVFEFDLGECSFDIVESDEVCGGEGLVHTLLRTSLEQSPLREEAFRGIRV